MVGVGETYLAAYVIAAGLGEFSAGLITTVPVLAGACLQLISAWGVKRIRSNKRWAAFAAATQSISMAVIALMVFSGRVSIVPLFIAASIYWFGGLAAGPAWNAWVQHVVPPQNRATYFGSRGRVCQLCILLGLLAAAAVLKTATSTQAFVILFAAAAAFRAFSALAIALGTELPDWRPKKTQPDLFQTIKSLDSSNYRLLGFLFSMQAAVFVAAPFFTPYMLGHLKLGYFEFTWLIALGFVGKIIAMPYAGKFAAQFGTNRSMLLGAVGIVPMAVAWVFTDSILALSLLQVVSGVLWAFYELATMLLFFEKIPTNQRVAALSVYNFGNAFAMVVGSLVGGLLLAVLGDGVFAYLVIFAVSSAARLASLLLAPALESRDEPLASIRQWLFVRFIALRPASGGWVRPIFSTQVEGGYRKAPKPKPSVENLPHEQPQERPRRKVLVKH